MTKNLWSKGTMGDSFESFLYGDEFKNNESLKKFFDRKIKRIK